MSVLLSIIIAVSSIGLLFSLINRFIAKPVNPRQATKMVYFFGIVSCSMYLITTVLPVGGAV